MYLQGSVPPPEDELRRLRAREEAEGDERGSGAGGHVHRGGIRSVEAGHELRSWMGEGHPPARPRYADLSRVKMPSEDQVERCIWNAMDDSGEVAEEKTERRPWICELVRSGGFRAIGLRVDAYDRDGRPSENESHGIVSQQHRTLQIAELCRSRERITRDGNVVVAEHDEGAVETREERSQATFSSRMRDEIARDADDVRPAPGDPLRCALARPVAPGQGRAKVEVREVADAQTVQGLWKTVDLNDDRARPEPPALEPSVDGTGKRGTRDEQRGNEYPGTLETSDTRPTTVCVWGRVAPAACAVARSRRVLSRSAWS